MLKTDVYQGAYYLLMDKSAELQPKRLRHEVVAAIPFESIIFEEEIGRGSYGVVYKGRYANQKVAIKVLRDTPMKTHIDFTEEVKALR